MTISEYDAAMLSALRRIAIALSVLAIVAVFILSILLAPVLIIIAQAALEHDPLDCIEKQECEPMDFLIPNARQIQS